jgi:hypothetical protein
MDGTLTQIPLIEIRESLNVVIAIFSFVISLLLWRYAYREWFVRGYRDLDWPAKFCMGLILIFAGEFIRSSTIWLILHLEGVTGTYKSDIAILLTALTLIVVGGSCVIRVMTPDRWGAKLWVLTLLVAMFAAIADYVIK